MSNGATGGRVSFKTSAELIADALGPESSRYAGSWLAALAVGVAYLAAALLGAQQPQSLPPGVAAAVWPAAGVAVAGVLVVGRICAPFVVLAAFVFNGISMGGYPLQQLPTTIALSLTMGVQPLVAEWLVRRFVRERDRLLSPLDGLLFMVFIGPLPHALSAFVVPWALTLVSLASYVASPFESFAWWTGDTIGALTVTPALLTVFGTPRACWQPRRLRLGVPLAFLLAWAAADFEHERRNVDDRRRGTLEQEAELAALEFESSIGRAREVVFGVVSYYRGSHEVTAREFEQFVARSLRSTPSLEGLFWVMPDERGALRVRFAEPESQRALIGADLSTDPELAEAFARAGDGGMLSGPTSAFGTPGRSAFVAAIPEGEAGDFRGWAVGAFDLVSMVAAVDASSDVLVCVLDVAAGAPLGGCDGTGPTGPVAAMVSGRSFAISVLDARGSLLAERNRQLAERYVLWLVALFSITTALLGLTGRNIALGLESDGRAKAEAALSEVAAALRETNAELEQFARMASHDLRAPLRAIQALAGFIEEDAGPRLAEDSREHLRLMRSRVARLDGMVEGLLQFSRAGRWKHPVESIDVARLVHEIADLQGAGAFEIAVGSMPRITGHKAPLSQVLSNLIGNAIKHHDRGAGRIVVSAVQRGDVVEFRVADDGPGILPADRDAVFEPFRTLRSRDEVEGSGMGLATVRRLVQAEGGRIWIEDAAGRGAVFVFTWPAARSLADE